MDELETTFELPEPTPTTAYIASKGGDGEHTCLSLR